MGPTKSWANKKPRPKPGFEENGVGGNAVDGKEDDVCERSDGLQDPQGQEMGVRSRPKESGDQKVKVVLSTPP